MDDKAVRHRPLLLSIGRHKKVREKEEDQRHGKEEKGNDKRSHLPFAGSGDRNAVNLHLHRLPLPNGQKVKDQKPEQQGGS